MQTKKKNLKKKELLSTLYSNTQTYKHKKHTHTHTHTYTRKHISLIWYINQIQMNRLEYKQHLTNKQVRSSSNVTTQECNTQGYDDNCIFTVMTFNVMLPFREFIKDYKQATRLKYMRQFFTSVIRRYPELTVIVLSELIPTGYIDYFKMFMKKLGFVHFATVKSAVLQQNGGLCIFSRGLIKHIEFRSFGVSCVYADCLANKGVLYAECVCKCGRHSIHTFGTHMQAWTSAIAQYIRKEQLHLIGKFIRDTVSKTKCNMHTPIVLCGDFNMDAHIPSELIEIKNSVQMLFPKCSNHSLRNTFDRFNTMAGFDGSWENSTQEYPRGCFNEFSTLGTCVCCPNQWLDYVLYKPNSNIKRATQCSISCDVRINGTGESQESLFVSDHYPVLCTFIFRVNPKVSSHTKRSKKKVQNVHTSSRSSKSPQPMVPCVMM